MKKIIIHTKCALAALMAVLVSALCARRASALTVFANIAEGTHTDNETKLTDAAITTRHLLYKIGSDANHIAVAGADDLVIGTVDDEASAAEEYVAVQLLGKGPTKRMVASEAMATTGVDVFQAASGKIALSGTRKVGVLKQTASADGDVVEVQDCLGNQLGTGATENVTTTNVITAAESGKTFFLNNATGFVSTLPAPAAGLEFTFINVTANTSGNHTVVTNSSANIIKGNQNSVAGDAGDTGTSDDTINFVANSSLAGDRVELISDGTSWFAYATSRVAAGITFTTAS
jgi:hypothetical protein